VKGRPDVDDEQRVEDRVQPERSRQAKLDDWRASERRTKRAARLEGVARGAGLATNATAEAAAAAAAAANETIGAAERAIAAAQGSLESARVTAAAADEALAQAGIAVEAAEADIARRTDAHERALADEEDAREEFHEREQSVRDRQAER
jgi:hypothetical protein